MSKNVPKACGPTELTMTYLVFSGQALKTRHSFFSRQNSFKPALSPIFVSMDQQSNQRSKAAGNDAALSSVNFDIIRYANCWEDAGMLLRAFEKTPPRNIAIVASAGDNALATLSANPESVLAFDISKPQLYLSELKQQAYAFLEREELLQLLGVSKATATQRTQLLDHIAQHLSASCRAYWRENKQVIADRTVHSGKFENYFRIFREYLLPLVHSRRTIADLFNQTPETLPAFYQKRWNNSRWKLLMRLFFSRYFMGRAGRDPQFLKQVQIPVADYIRQRTELHLQSPVAMHNHFLQFIFTGNFSTLLPHYLRPDLHESIRRNIGRMTITQGSADDIVSLHAHDAYCLSNIFEYYPQADFDATVERWKSELAPDSRLLYWNLMVPRSFAAAAPDAYLDAGIPDRNLDSGFFYSAFLNEARR
jgi:S-adenosylmethionine-diacylglycerol 3-amino-3-carboxypropyl transferase